MGLIDADVLMTDVRNTITEKSRAVDWINLINRQPTAYDVDKVVEQLKSESARWQDSGDAYNDEKEKGVAIGVRKAIEIVKGGGIDA